MNLVLNTIIFTVIALIAFLLNNAGFFTKIKVFRDKVPKMTIAGFRFKGTYIIFYIICIQNFIFYSISFSEENSK